MWPADLSSKEILRAWLEVRIEREGQDDPVHFKADRAKATGAHLCFLSWLYLMRGGLKPFVGWPWNLGQSLLMLNEATTAS